MPNITEEQGAKAADAAANLPQPYSYDNLALLQGDPEPGKWADQHPPKTNLPVDLSRRGSLGTIALQRRTSEGSPLGPRKSGDFGR